MAADLEGVRLLVERPCGACDAGEVLTDEWAEFEIWRGQNPSFAGDLEEFFVGVRGLDEVPETNRACGACEGGWVRETVTFEDLAAAVTHAGPLMLPDELQTVAGDVKRSLSNAAVQSAGVFDADERGSWLRVVQEGAEALRALDELGNPGWTP